MEKTPSTKYSLEFRQQSVKFFKVPGAMIRDGPRAMFNQDDARNWYVIPGNGDHNSDDSDVVVRPFYYVQ